jgi:integrase
MSKQPKRTCLVCGGRAKYLTRLYIEGSPFYLGYACTKAHRREAQEAKRVELRAEAEQASKPKAETVTGAELVSRYLAWYAIERKASSLDTARQQLRRFAADFGTEPIGSIDRERAKAWASAVPACEVSRVRALFGYAIDEEWLTGLNPFRKLSKKGKGRADKAPPTVAELERLLDACAVLGDYGPQMRALIVVGAYTGMRPGELYELRWSDVRFEENRIVVSRRLYRGHVDVPKNGEPKTIALPPPAKDALIDLPLGRERLPEGDELVFLSKQGKRLQARRSVSTSPWCGRQPGSTSPMTCTAARSTWPCIGCTDSA